MSKINITLSRIKHPIKFNIIIRFLINTISKSFLIIVIPYLIENMLLYINSKDELESVVLYISKILIFMLVVEIIYIQNNKRAFILFNKIRRDFTQDINKKFMEMDYEYYEDSKKLDEAYFAYDVTYSNYDGIEGIYHTFFELGWKIIVLVYFLFYFYKINYLFLILFFCIGTVSFLLSKRLKMIELKNVENVNSSKRKMIYFSYNSSDYSYGKDTRVYEFSNSIKKLYYKILSEFINTLNIQENAKKFIFLLDEIIFYFLYIIAFYILFLEYNRGIGIGKVISVLGILSYLIYLIKDFINDLSFCYGELKRCEYTFNFLNIDYGSSGIDINKISSIEFKNVYFKYPNTENFVIEDCSFSIDNGEKIAFIGLNGSGKTTITKLILGLYKATSGTIYINGINIEQLNLKRFFKNISYVEQETNLISMSVVEFITGKDKNYDEDRLIQSLKDAEIFKKINLLEKGIFSKLTNFLDKDGINLSGGEVQKLYIARALYRDSSLYIFDEPTASLDVISERKVYERLNKISGNNIAIFISHKLKTTNFCDKIFVLQEGNVFEIENKKNSNLQYLYSKLSNLFFKENKICD